MRKSLLEVSEVDVISDDHQRKRLLQNIGFRIKELRMQAGLSQEEFYNVTNIHIARLETGKQNVSIFTLQLICSYLGVTLPDFFRNLRD